MIKAVLMDVGRTIVTSRIIDFGKGLKAVYDLDKRRDKCDLNEYFRVFTALTKVSFEPAREISSEVRITDFLAALNEITGIKLPNEYQDPKELEYFFQCNLIEEELVDGVKDFLKYVKKSGLPVIAVSNSCMSSNALRREFKEYDIEKYFNDIISSADILIRKPRHEIFDFAYGKLVGIDNTIKKDEVVFIGDDFDCDVVGSLNGGLVAIWLNKMQEEPKNNVLPQFNVKDYNEIIEIIESINNKK